jgi:hypothetical protein
LWYFEREKDSVYTSIAPPSDLADAMDIRKPLQEFPLVTTEGVKRTDQKERYSLNVEYPSVVLATDPRTAQLVSDVIRGEVMRMIDDFLINAREMSNTENIPPEFVSDLTVRYQPVLLTPSVIAVRLDHSAYIRGAAHPDSGVRIVLYDIRAHALLSTADLFLAGSDYLAILSGYTRDRLKIIFPDLSTEEFGNTVILGTQPIAENFREVLVTGSGLTVFFNPYQVAPYARGVVTVDVPYADIQSHLTETVKGAIGEANASSSPVSEPSILMQN